MPERKGENKNNQQNITKYKVKKQEKNTEPQKTLTFDNENLTQGKLTVYLEVWFLFSVGSVLSYAVWMGQGCVGKLAMSQEKPKNACQKTIPNYYLGERSLALAFSIES